MAGIKRRIILKDQILNAIRHSTSIKGTASYLGVPISLLKPFLLEYKDDNTEKSLYETYFSTKNKFSQVNKRKIKNKRITIHDLFQKGMHGLNSYTEGKIFREGIKLGYIKDECSCCGYNASRHIDGKKPLVLIFKDKNRKNWITTNLLILCFNCYFINISDISSEIELKKAIRFNKKDMSIENNIIDDNIIDDNEEEDIYKYVTRNIL